MEGHEEAGAGFARLSEIIGTLRGENGCPWDREQDERTILSYLLEEVYEAVEAVQTGKAEAVLEELGDVLMEVVFLARIFEEKGAFRLSDAVESINRKMTVRHPHVFGTARLDSSRRVLEAWHRQKREEKNRDSLFDGLSRTLPALAAAFQIGQRASSVGFDWRRAEEAEVKLREEMAELSSAMEAGDRAAVDHEVGDLLFAAANVARKAGVNPEMALLQANARFLERFAHIEKRLKDSGRELAGTTLEEMDALWEEAKSREVDG